MVRKSISVLLLLVMIVSIFTVASASAESSSKYQMTVSDDNELSVTGTDSFGSMLSEELEKEADKQTVSTEAYIYSVEVNEKNADVQFWVNREAQLTVAIYSDDCKEMYCSATVTVFPNDENATLEFSIEEMPDSFFVKAFLVDEANYKPLCTAYESPNYTLEMQEFFAKKATDFPEGQLLNLDNSTDNNFAVYKDDVLRLQDDEGVNTVSSVNDTDDTYIIENADEKTASLVEGDVFTYNDNGKDVIVKVGSITVAGTTVTITSDNVTPEEVFDYIKIDTSTDYSSYSEEGKDERLELVDDELQEPSKNDLAETGAPNLDIEGNLKKTRSFSIPKKAGAGEGEDDKWSEVTGSFDVTLAGSVKFYLSPTQRYLEFKAEYELKLAVKASLSADAGFLEGKFSFGIGKLKLSPMMGLYITFSPKLFLDVSGSIEINGTMKGSIGVKCSSQTGKEEYIEPASFDAEFKAEVTVYAGLDLNPTVTILADLVTVDMTAKVGVEVKASLDYEAKTNDSEQHDCLVCIDGDISFKLELSVTIQFFKWIGSMIPGNDKEEKDVGYTINIPSLTVKIADFYYSSDYHEYGFTTCPHKRYKVTAVIINESGDSVENVAVNTENHTDKDGRASFYLPNGSYSIEIDDGFAPFQHHIQVQDEPLIFSTQVSSQIPVGDIAYLAANRTKVAQTKTGQIFRWGSSEKYTSIKTPQLYDLSQYGFRPEQIKRFEEDATSFYLLLKDGRFYVWGTYNYNGHIGDGTTSDRNSPVLIMENVRTYAYNGSQTFAITYDNELYGWGGNGKDDTLMCGGITYVLSPHKLADHVKSVACGSGYGYIKENGDLYIAGRFSEWETYGIGTSYLISPPRKMLDHVKCVEFGLDQIGAVKDDGSLYMWGENRYGELGNGTSGLKKGSRTPIKIADNIKSINFDWGESAALSNDGILYVWGQGVSWNGTDWGPSVYCTTPRKVAEKVLSFTADDYCLYYFDKNGKLYAYGRNYNYAYGNNMTDTVYRPVEIVLPSTVSIASTAASRSLASTGADDETVSAIQAQHRASFDNLEPKSVYNFYSVRSKSVDDVLNRSNLLYVNQITTDDNGHIDISYIPFDDCDQPVEFVVAMDHISIDQLSISEKEVYYNGQVQYYDPVVCYGETRLKIGTDYMLFGEISACNTGEYAVEIVGKGLYKGALSSTFVISRADFSKVEIKNTASLTYDGTPKIPTLQLTYNNIILEEGVDYQVTDYRDNVSAGTAYADIEGLGNFSGSRSFSYYIQPIYFSEESVFPSVLDYQLYNMESNVPDIKVTIGEKELVKGTDYEIECYSNETYGYVDVYVYGIGNYGGWVRINIRGDIDRDSSVTGRDLVLLQRYLNSTPEEREDLWLSVEAADINADGEVNDSDVTALREFLKSHRVSDNIRPENAENDSSIKKISVSSDEVSVGETISVPITIANNQGFSYLRMSFNYDKSELAFLSAVNGEVSDSIFSNNKNIVFWNADDDIDENGRLVTLKFKVLEEAVSYDIQYKCSECYNSNRNYIEAELSNDTVDVIDPSTCNHLDEDNNDICDICGTSLSAFVGHSLTLEGDIGVNFYVDVPEESIDDVESVTFTWEVNGIEKTHSVSLIDCDKNDLGYKLSCPVPAAEMNYEITATVTVGGETYTNSYSAVTYAQTILSDDYRTSYLADNHTEAEYSELATLVKTMLDYGAKAQIQFNRNIDHLANEGIDYTPTEVTADTIGDTGASDMRAGLAAYGLEYNGSSIVYLSETSMRHYYKIVDEDLFNAVKDNITFDGKKVSYTWKNGEIYFELKNIAAAELDDLYTLKIGDSEYKYSVLDYLKACLSSDKTTANMKALAAATYLYNQAANAYFD